MTFPTRVVVALTVIGMSAVIAVWGLRAALRAERLTEPQRMIAAGSIMLTMALLAMWVIFVWPAYWE